MAVVKKHWLSLVLSLVICGLATFGISIPYLLSGSVQAQLAETQPEIEPRILDAPTYSLLQQVRQELSLTDNDLAAIGCSERQAEEVAAYIADWVTTKQMQIREAVRTRRQLKRQAQEIYRQMNIGTYQASHHESLSNIHYDISENNKQYKLLIESVIPSLGTKFSEASRELWVAARRNKKETSVARYLPDLTDTQKAALAEAQDSRTTELSDPSADRILTSGQMLVLDSVRSNLQFYKPVIKRSVNRVVPVPEDLQAKIVAQSPQEVIRKLQY